MKALKIIAGIITTIGLLADWLICLLIYAMGYKIAILPLVLIPVVLILPKLVKALK